MHLFSRIIWLILAVPAFSWADDPPKKSLKEVIITATRFEQDPKELPIGVSVINAEQIKNSAALTLPELLQQFAGVHIRNLDGGPDQQIDLRGFGITGNQNTLVLLDGQRMNENELVGIRWSTIPLNSIERIEILRSSGAVTYGSGATGGVINIVTRSAEPDRISGNAGFSYGSYGGMEFKGALNVARKNFGLALTVNALKTDNYRANNDLNQKSLQGDLRYQFRNGSAMLKFGLDDQKLELPANRTELQLQIDRRGTSTPRDFSMREGAYVTLRGKYNIRSANLAADLSFRDNHRTALFDDYFIGDFFDSKVFVNINTDVWLFNPRIKLPFQTTGISHELVLGGNFEWWDYHSKRFTGPEAIPGAAFANILRADVVAEQQNKAGYLQYAATLPLNTVVTLGGRLQWVHSKANDRFNSAAYASDQQHRTVHAYDVGVRQPLGSALSFYGKYGRSFRIATVDEIYNQFGGPAFDSIINLLEPQTAHTGEFGLEYRQGTIRARASVYRTNLNNEIGFIIINPFVFFANLNLPPTRRQGVEFEGSWSPIDKLDIFGSYTFSDARFRKGTFGGVDVSGNTIPLVPRHSASATSILRITSKTRLSATINYVGKQVYDNDQANSFSQRMPDYVTVDLKFAHQIANWFLSFVVNNLFDEKYYSYGIRNGAGTSFSALPARKRNFWFTIKYQLN
ncbi:MAG: TonB-dependent receptor [Betaproteobacteria bacterium]|nr:MAG: TonB-dependent receptor [Betaproteobacteria bacterium]